jgi:hypothetical protein
MVLHFAPYQKRMGKSDPLLQETLFEDYLLLFTTRV